MDHHLSPGTTADLAIIGSGGAAFAAAIRAREDGLRVVMVERGVLGGTCVNTGCVPSKALLAAAEARHTAGDGVGRFAGISATVSPVDMPALVEGTQRLVAQLRAEKYQDIAAAHGWEILPGHARFAGAPEDPVLTVTAQDGTVTAVEAQHHLIATGSRPTLPPVPGLEDVTPLTSTSAMQQETLPGSLLVLGGGPVALEQAQLFARLGSQVTLLVRSRLVSREEPEASHALTEALREDGIHVVLQAAVDRLRADPVTSSVTAEVRTPDGGQVVSAERLLVAVGRTPNTEDLGLEQVGVRTGQRGEVLVTEQLVSSNPRIWAAGDVTGGREFVYVAAAQGALMVANAFHSAGRALDDVHLPSVTFTSPAIARAGMTRAMAEAADIDHESRTVPMSQVPRARVQRDTRGLITVVAQRQSGRILGVSAVARDAGELAASAVHLLDAERTVEQVAGAWAPYLTMAEGLKLTCQAFSTDVTTLSCCAV